MAADAVRTTLAEHLGMEAVGPLAEKRLLGGYQVRFLPFLWAEVWVFLKGVVLGRARQDRLEILARLLTQPGNELHFCSEMRKAASKIVNDYGREPDSFTDFYLKIAFPKVDIFDLNLMKGLSKKKLRLGVALQRVDLALFFGIGFGSTFPELTERLWKQTFETHGPTSWATARRAGLDIPEQFTALPLQEMQHIVLFAAADYVGEYFPELVEPLGLRLT